MQPQMLSRAHAAGSVLVRQRGVQTRNTACRSWSGCYASASHVGRRQAIALIASPALLLAAAPAEALNFDRYIRGRKLPPLDAVLIPTLFCAEVLSKIEERLAAASPETFDSEDTRELLRLGPFTRFRENLRVVAKVEGADATSALAEDALLTLNAFDAQLVRFGKAEAEDLVGKAEALVGARREIAKLRRTVQKVIDLAQKSAEARGEQAATAS